MEPLLTSALDYPLDPARVAQTPAVPRDSARLMVVDRAARSVQHARVRDLPQWLHAGDALALNRTRVMRARFVGARETTGDQPGRRTEGLLLQLQADGTWSALLRDARRFKEGARISLMAHDGREHGDWVEVCGRSAETVTVRLHSADGAPLRAIVERSGWTPLPPYIARARQKQGAALPDDKDREWYQTVYATGAAGTTGLRESVAAPTAGLHFTAELMRALASGGVSRFEVELQVGAGTFKPVESRTLAEHRMHREWCHVPEESLHALRRLAAERNAGRARIVAVGTTSVRTLETLPDPLPGPAQDGWSSETDLLIQPGHRFRMVDALLTNFHLPRSTLLALVGAFVGLDWLKELYAQAQAEEYRFFSYGDAMLIV